MHTLEAAIEQYVTGIVDRVLADRRRELDDFIAVVAAQRADIEQVVKAVTDSDAFERTIRDVVARYGPGSDGIADVVRRMLRDDVTITLDVK